MDWKERYETTYIAGAPARQREMHEKRHAAQIDRKARNATIAFWLGIGSIIVVGTLYAILLAVI